MTTHIALHGRQTPVIDAISGVYVLGSSMLRHRAIYIHARGRDHYGRPTLGPQLARVGVSSYRDDGKVQLSLHLLDWDCKIPLPSVRWMTSHRWPITRPLYRFWQRVLNPDRRSEGSPRWNEACE